MRKFIIKVIIVTIATIIILLNIPSNIEFSIKHKHTHEFSYYSPLEIKLSDPGYPLNIRLQHEGMK